MARQNRALGAPPPPDVRARAVGSRARELHASRRVLLTYVLEADCWAVSSARTTRPTSTCVSRQAFTLSTTTPFRPTKKPQRRCAVHVGAHLRAMAATARTPSCARRVIAAWVKTRSWSARQERGAAKDRSHRSPVSRRQGGSVPRGPRLHPAHSVLWVSTAWGARECRCPAKCCQGFTVRRGQQAQLQAQSVRWGTGARGTVHHQSRQAPPRR